MPHPPTIGREEEEGGARLLHPANLIDLLLNLQTLQVVKLWLMALKRAVDIVVTFEDGGRGDGGLWCTLHSGGRGRVTVVKILQVTFLSLTLIFVPSL